MKLLNKRPVLNADLQCSEPLPHLYWMFRASEIEEEGSKLKVNIDDLIAFGKDRVKICRIDTVQPSEKWYLVYGHILPPEKDTLPREAWQNLYGNN